MHDVAVALDAAKGTNFNAAGLGDAAEVVAGEIDEHDVLGGFFGVGQQFALEGEVGGVGVAAFAGAGDWSEGRDAALEFDEGLG